MAKVPKQAVEWSKGASDLSKGARSVLKKAVTGGRKGAYSFSKSAGGAGAGAGGAGAPLGWGALLKAGDVKGMLKKPGGIFGALFIAQLLLGHFLKKKEGIEQTGMQGEVMNQQADMSEDDRYYQAMMPELAQERKGAQDALMQVILGSRGQALQVPGERQI